MCFTSTVTVFTAFQQGFQQLAGYISRHCHIQIWPLLATKAFQPCFKTQRGPSFIYSLLLKHMSTIESHREPLKTEIIYNLFELTYWLLFLLCNTTWIQLFPPYRSFLPTSVIIALPLPGDKSYRSVLRVARGEQTRLSCNVRNAKLQKYLVKRQTR